jgi:hypothetical protein
VSANPTEIKNMKPTRSEIAVQAAAETNMSATVWTGSDETRIYLRRKNAARTEAGYIRLYSKDGKMWSSVVVTASGKGARTAQFEAEATLARYKMLWKASQSATA